jgi:plasmid stabilization system protein ParE
LRAFADREAIFDYIEQHSPQGALNVMRAIENSIAGWSTFPIPRLRPTNRMCGN